MARRSTVVVWLFAAVVTLSLPSSILLAVDAAAGASDASSAERHAFETAKELGTSDAWNAFLTSYPSGFYADMARAYLKKGDAPQKPAAVEKEADNALPPSSARASERPCSEREDLLPEHSKEPTKITFVNKSGMYRAIMWIDFDGKLQDYGGVNSGDRVTFDTFRTHPWVIATGPGDCLQIFMPAAEPSTVELLRVSADDPKPAKPDKPKKPQAQKPPPPKKLVCGTNYKLVNGQCVLQQNCGANAYRSPEGDCYCKKGYKMKRGKCEWPHDKQGFEIAPEKKSICPGLQARCNRGEGAACIKYEENCQVN